MDKLVILDKFKKENILGDERERDIKIRGQKFGTTVLTFGFCLLLIINLANKKPVNDLMFLYFIYMSSLELYRYRKDKNKLNLIGFLSSGLVALGNLAIYFLDTIGR